VSTKPSSNDIPDKSVCDHISASVEQWLG